MISYYFLCFPAQEFDMDEEQNQFQNQNDEFVDKDGFALPEDELESISAEVTSQRDKKRKTKKAPNKAAYTMIRLITICSFSHMRFCQEAISFTESDC